MSWKDDMKLRDLDDSTVIEATCVRCRYMWKQSPIQLLIKVDHRDVYMIEVEKNLACPRPHCRHVGTRIELVRNHDTSGFVGGMP